MTYLDYSHKIHEVLTQTKFFQDGQPCASTDFFASILNCLRNVSEKGQSLFLVGNGASCSIADHFSADFAKNAQIKTLSIGNSLYSALSNDDAFEKTLSHFIQLHRQDIGLVVAISSSGESPNIVHALQTSAACEIPSLSLTGKAEDNTARILSSFSVYCPSSYYGEVESAHACIMHYIIDSYLDTHKNGRL